MCAFHDTMLLDYAYFMRLNVYSNLFQSVKSHHWVKHIQGMEYNSYMMSGLIMDAALAVLKNAKEVSRGTTMVLLEWKLCL